MICCIRKIVQNEKFLCLAFFRLCSLLFCECRARTYAPEYFIMIDFLLNVLENKMNLDMGAIEISKVVRLGKREAGQTKRRPIQFTVWRNLRNSGQL